MTKHVLIIDNYDSFTYNLYQAFEALGAKVTVEFNDAINKMQAEALRPTHLVISPGPGTPTGAGNSNEMISHFHNRIPILGVCLGHQCIGHVFGANLVQASRLMHGKTSMVLHDERGIFSGVLNPFPATRYHSLILQSQDFPLLLKITAKTEEDEIMGVRVQGTKTEGVQFHPESYMTKEGTRLLKNFLDQD